MSDFKFIEHGQYPLIFFSFKIINVNRLYFPLYFYYN